MLSANQKKILECIYKKINNEQDRIILEDFVSLCVILMALYARNFFKRNSNWHKMKLSYKIDYKYIRDNECSYRLTEIENEIKKYTKVYDMNNENFNDLITYAKKNINELVTDIAKPLHIMSAKIRDLLDKYKDYKYSEYKLSTKINYDVFQQIIKENILTDDYIFKI